MKPSTIIVTVGWHTLIWLITRLAKVTYNIIIQDQGLSFWARRRLSTYQQFQRKKERFFVKELTAFTKCCAALADQQCDVTYDCFHRNILDTLMLLTLSIFDAVCLQAALTNEWILNESMLLIDSVMSMIPWLTLKRESLITTYWLIDVSCRKSHWTIPTTNAYKQWN